MKATSHITKIIVVSACGLVLAACSSTKHRGGAGMEGEGIGGANGAYAQGLGSEAGFQPSTSCNIPGNANAVFFDFDQSNVHPEDQSRLQNLGQSLGANHGKIRLIGNTDDRGSREYNVALGWRRANSVASVLQQNGASKAQIQTESNGAEKPIAYGQSEEDFQCNRRVDITKE